MSLENLKAIASGRVWTGRQAKENGLIDVLGGLQTAIDIAAAKAGIEDDYKLRYYPARKSSLEELMDELSGTTKAKMMKSELGEFYPYLDLLEKVKNIRGVQARIPFEIDIR